jgi:hypothetical protein
VINGLQDRSKRNLTLVSSLLGGIGLLNLIGGLSTANQNMALLAALEGRLSFWTLLAMVVALLVSMGSFGASMGQVPVAQNGIVPKRTFDEWTALLTKSLSKMESFHTIGGWCLSAAAALAAVSIILLAFGC